MNSPLKVIGLVLFGLICLFGAVYFTAYHTILFAPVLFAALLFLVEAFNQSPGRFLVHLAIRASIFAIAAIFTSGYLTLFISGFIMYIIVITILRFIAKRL